MLLDSSDGLIRVFPCYDRDASFRLPAHGGFWVEAQQQAGNIEHVRIHSRFGGRCRVRTNWHHCWISSETETQELSIQNAVVSFNTSPNQEYLLTPSCNQSTSPELVGHTAAPLKNEFACLGLFPCF